jgi:hypothetical protein
MQVVEVDPLMLGAHLALVVLVVEVQVQLLLVQLA